MTALVAVMIASTGAACTQSDVQFKPDFDVTTDPVPFEVEMGVPFDLGDKDNRVNVAVLNIDAFDQTPERFPRLRLAMRSENVSDRTLNNPDVQLRCDESTQGGQYFGGSTWEMNAVIKSGEFREGELYIGFPPKDSNPQYAVASCTNPKLVMTGTRWNDRQQFVAVMDVPDEVISAAVDSPIGQHLPLPVSEQ